MFQFGEIHNFKSLSLYCKPEHQSVNMKKYFLKIFYFCIPVLLYFLFIFLVDPYEFINVSHIISSEDKQIVFRRNDETSPRGVMLWKAIHYKRDPVKSILIGDSQGGKIKEDLVEELTGKEFYNFCVPGASYKTMFETFWFATEQTQLKSVYFQLAFMNYNLNRSYTLFNFAQDYINKPYLYFFNREIFFDSFYNFLYTITKNENLVKNSYEYHPVEMLNKKSEDLLRLFFKDYSYPEEYRVELERIAKYCDDNDIDLTFIIMPTYDITFDYLEENSLGSAYKTFKHDIQKLGHTHDYWIKSDFSKDRNNFLDFFHPKQPIIDKITIEVWQH